MLMAGTSTAGPSRAPSLSAGPTPRAHPLPSYFKILSPGRAGCVDVDPGHRGTYCCQVRTNQRLWFEAASDPVLGFGGDCPCGGMRNHSRCALALRLSDFSKRPERNRSWFRLTIRTRTWVFCSRRVRRRDRLARLSRSDICAPARFRRAGLVHLVALVSFLSLVVFPGRVVFNAGVRPTGADYRHVAVRFERVAGMAADEDRQLMATGVVPRTA